MNKRPTRKKIMTDFYTGTPDTSATDEEDPPRRTQAAQRNGESKYDLMEDEDDDE